MKKETVEGKTIVVIRTMKSALVLMHGFWSLVICWRGMNGNLILCL